MNLFFSQGIRENSKVLPEHGGHSEDASLRLKYQVLFLMNEFAVMKRMEVMGTAPALTRGAGLRYLIIFQNKNQVCSEECYGCEGGKAVMEPFHVEVVYAPGNIDVATEYSRRLGNCTLKVATDSQNIAEGQRRSKGKSFSWQARSLMLPQEINELPYEEALFRERVNDEIYPSPVVPKGDPEKIAVLTTPVNTTIKNKVEVSRPEGDGIIEEALKRGIGQAD